MRWLVVLACISACEFRHGATMKPDAPADAAAMLTVTCDQTTCNGVGGTCLAGTCVIAAGTSATCPQGETCSINCEVDNVSCTSGVTCGTGATCDLHCDADHSCDSNVNITCGAGATCNISCKGTHSCDAATVNCDSTATCIYHCYGGQSCNPINCGAASCSMGNATCP